MTTLVALWFGWVCVNLALMLWAGIASPTATFNGFWIRIPAHLRGLLSERELEAVRLHEAGHRARGHVWRNFARRVFFLRVSKRRLQMQEMEADSYAAERGYGEDLARALLRRGAQGFTLVRAMRLLTPKE